MSEYEWGLPAGYNGMVGLFDDGECWSCQGYAELRACECDSPAHSMFLLSHYARLLAGFVEKIVDVEEMTK